MLVTVYLLAEGLVSGAELLLCLRDGEWARVGRDRAERLPSSMKNFDEPSSPTRFASSCSKGRVNMQ